MKHLIAKEGFKYTQASDVEIQNRVIASEIYLAVNDSENNWTQISNKEAEEIKVKQSEYFKKREAEFKLEHEIAEAKRLEAKQKHEAMRKEMELKRLKEGK